MAMNKRSSKTATLKLRNRGDNVGTVCNQPLCFRFDVEFKANITLDSVDLYDPDAPGDEPWVKFDKSLLDTQGTNAAKAALDRAAQDGIFTIQCQDEGCVCRTRGSKWGGWTPWGPVEICGGFSTPNPNPSGQPPKLRYRANGTVQARARMKIGICYHSVG